MADVSDPGLAESQVDMYLERLGIKRSEATPDIDGLRALHLAHLERVPFENLDIVYAGGVSHDALAAFEKITGSKSGPNRGGWCFELNGAFALLLSCLGFEVRLLGAAVLLDGPTQVIEHVLLEVEAPGLRPHLVDVGFGDSFDLPLALNTPGPQDGGSGEFELIASPQGTTVARHVDGIPQALLRFKRVAHSFADFATTAQSMQDDPTKKWATHPFATRRLPGENLGDAGRVTLSHDRLKVRRGGTLDEHAVDQAQWSSELSTWFAMDLPGPAQHAAD